MIADVWGDAQVIPPCAMCGKASCYTATVFFRGYAIDLNICRRCEEVCFWTEEEIEKMLVNRSRQGVQLELPLGA